MRVKLSEKCKKEREDICDKIISILDLDDEKSAYIPYKLLI